ncbi:hypothetical protein NBO_76g0027 [Nosema bombycis CQ1]|uniref:Uncharacterized protein n=1 Tax=Nosema bombycis (strain CQ1 / CVCC 102059) TaxID=578461 RepID=R0M629_NOSB1|nr:hypothetical protein NBO_76g0027 [Nosema bombycis CQ1]|eukprot:EOB13424.1 hypothetical protein NBO_76g0027 [Nosema bombycis CQ1]
MRGTQLEVTVSGDNNESIESEVENQFKYARYIPMADGREFYEIEVSPPVVKEQQFPQIKAEDKSTQNKNKDGEIVNINDRLVKLEIARIDEKEKREKMEAKIVELEEEIVRLNEQISFNDMNFNNDLNFNDDVNPILNDVSFDNPLLNDDVNPILIDNENVDDPILNDDINPILNDDTYVNNPILNDDTYVNNPILNDLSVDNVNNNLPLPPSSNNNNLILNDNNYSLVHIPNYSLVHSFNENNTDSFANNNTVLGVNGSLYTADHVLRCLKKKFKRKALFTVRESYYKIFPRKNMPSITLYRTLLSELVSSNVIVMKEKNNTTYFFYP